MKRNPMNDDDYTSNDAQIADLKAEVERLRDLNPWQPIETAPRDDTEVFVFEPGLKNDPDDKGFCDFASWVDGDWKSERGFSRPSHWMPVPELPPTGDGQ